MIKKFWWVGVVVVIAGAALLYYLRGVGHEPVMVATTTETPPPVAAPENPPIENPVPAGTAPGETPLPALDDSDKPMAAAIAQLIGNPIAQKILRPETLVRHIVATVDNLNRQHAGLSLRPVTNVPGKFAVLGDEIHSTLDPANFQRYTPYVHLVQKTDTKQLTALYFRYYPLFQQAYEELGYPKGYFNDELVKTLDSMIATPDAPAIIDLVQPNVNFQFADPALEDLTAGQKILLRIGPLNAAIVKAKLRELRALVATKTPVPAAADATSAPAAAATAP